MSIPMLRSMMLKMKNLICAVLACIAIAACASSGGGSYVAGSPPSPPVSPQPPTPPPTIASPSFRDAFNSSSYPSEVTFPLIAKTTNSPIEDYQGGTLIVRKDSASSTMLELVIPSLNIDQTITHPSDFLSDPQAIT